MRAGRAQDARMTFRAVVPGRPVGSFYISIIYKHKHYNNHYYKHYKDERSSTPVADGVGGRIEPAEPEAPPAPFFRESGKEGFIRRILFMRRILLGGFY